MHPYRIRFKHVTNPDLARVVASSRHGVPAEKIQAVTICTLEDQDKRVVGIGHGFCSVKDTFSKEKGRRVALAAALDDAFPYERSNGAGRVNILVRRERERLWSLYFSRNEGRFDPRRKRHAA
jgi:hypothetical protein